MLSAVEVFLYGTVLRRELPPIRIKHHTTA